VTRRSVSLAAAATIGIAVLAVVVAAHAESGQVAMDPTTSAAVAGFAQRQVSLAPAVVTPGDAATYSVDTSTGDLYATDQRGVVKEFIDRNASTANAGTGNLDDNTLIARARAFAAKHFPASEIASMAATVHRRNDGIERDGTKHWVVEVDLRKLLNGVPTFAHVTCLMNPATGAVVGVTHDGGSTSVSTIPSFAANAAVSLVAGHAQMIVHTLVRCELDVVRDFKTNQPRLVWQIEMHTGDSHFGSTAWGTVDACTGELMQFNES
jgi:hypothetical protein